MKRYILQYKFNMITIHGEIKEVKNNELMFDKFEDLLAHYREKKNAKVKMFPYMQVYHDFHVYTCILEEQDIKKLDDFL